MYSRTDIEAARNWLLEHAHGTHTRHVLERGLEYAEAIQRAGVPLEAVGAEELYSLLTDERVDAARRDAFVEATL